MRFPLSIGSAGLALGTAAAVFYAQRGLTLSHYDAKAHLVVARRILDSLTPEYSQIGAVWLPLPHVINMLPVQIDALYRSGASGVAFSVISFAIACAAIAWLVVQVTGSRGAAALAAALFALQPDVLYLQATPMTEPLLFGLVLVAVASVYRWVRHQGDLPPDAAGLLLILACLTRYEAWFVTAAAIALAVLALLKQGLPAAVTLRRVAHLAAFPAIAIVGFFFHSWFTTGAWFVTGGFYVPDNVAEGRPFAALVAVGHGVRMLGGRPLLVAGLVGACVVLVRGLRDRQHAPALVVLSLLGFFLLPAYAFYNGHPFRMRYMVAPTVAMTVLGGIALGCISGWPRRALMATAVGWMIVFTRPFDLQSPMVQEAQWDVPFSQGRQEVTACLMREYQGELILASMGSLAHYMQELSHQGIGIRQFVHEGNLPHWQQSIESPRGQVGWILIEERAEGGDELSARARSSSAFLTGFRHVCSGGGVSLYRAST